MRRRLLPRRLLVILRVSLFSDVLGLEAWLGANAFFPPTGTSDHASVRTRPRKGSVRLAGVELNREFLPLPRFRTGRVTNPYPPLAFVRSPGRDRSGSGLNPTRLFGSSRKCMIQETAEGPASPTRASTSRHRPTAPDVSDEEQAEGTQLMMGERS
jgi:hypothetical protein